MLDDFNFLSTAGRAMTAMWEGTREKGIRTFQKTKGFEKVMKIKRVIWSEELREFGNV